MIDYDEIRKDLAHAFENYSFSIQNNDIQNAERWKGSILDTMLKLNEFDIFERKRREGRATPRTRYHQTGFNRDIYSE